MFYIYGARYFFTRAEFYESLQIIDGKCLVPGLGWHSIYSITASFQGRRFWRWLMAWPDCPWPHVLRQIYASGSFIPNGLWYENSDVTDKTVTLVTLLWPIEPDGRKKQLCECQTTLWGKKRHRLYFLFALNVTANCDVFCCRAGTV